LECLKKLIIRWKWNFISWKYYNYESVVTVITPLLSRVVVNFVQLLITIYQREITQTLADIFMCLTLLSSGAINKSDKLPLRQFPSFRFVLTYRAENGKRITQRRNEDWDECLLIFCYYCVMMCNFVAWKVNTTQYNA
jgi:hypothetical protein